MTKLPLEGFELFAAPGHLLRRCHQRSQKLYSEETSQFGITRQQFAMLLVIMRHPGLSIQELADLAGVDRNTLSGIIARLQKKSLLKRQRAQDDARAYELKVTPEGVAVLRQMEPAIKRTQQRILAPLTQKEQREFVRLAQKLSNHPATKSNSK